MVTDRLQPSGAIKPGVVLPCVSSVAPLLSKTWPIALLISSVFLAVTSLTFLNALPSFFPFRDRCPEGIVHRHALVVELGRRWHAPCNVTASHTGNRILARVDEVLGRIAARITTEIEDFDRHRSRPR